MRPDEAGLRRAVESLTGRRVAGSERLTGGDFAQAFRFELDDDTLLFAKTHPNPRPGFFATEAAGLAWLRCADAIPVPEVLAASDGGSDGSLAMLIMEWIPPAADRRADDQAFGATLARLHDAGAPTFGRTDRRTTGSLGLPNDPCDDWATFYGSCRLLPLARLAADAKALPATTIARLERLAHSLDAFDDGEPPSRLHGDLWAGNRIVDVTGRSWLIDPAAHGGHREFDLAMMHLFGGFGQESFAAYQDAHPLLPGWQDRIQLHQIAPLVVHAIKFGRSYVDAATAAIMRY